MTVRIHLAAGARDAERRLLSTVDYALEAGVDGLAPLERLRTPIRIVVPSRSLRDHLCARLVEHRGRAVAGVVVSTHRALAHELANRIDTRGPGPRRGDASSTEPELGPEQAGAPTSAESLPVAILARRAAARHRVLASVLDEEGRRDPFASVATTVEDLLDAGLELAHVDALEEWLGPRDAQRTTPAIQARARAVLRVAATTATMLDDALEQSLVPALVPPLGRPFEARQDAFAQAHPTLLLRHAIARIDRWSASADELDLLPTQVLIVHGYADATGVVTDFLELLLRTFGGEAIIDLPPEAPSVGALPAPANETASSSEAASSGETPARRARDFPARLRHRLETVATQVEDSLAGSTSVHQDPGGLSAVATPRLVEAADPLAELRAVAVRIRQLLAGGQRPESIAIVARDPKPSVRVLRTAFAEHNIPYSACGLRGPLDPPGRLLMGLLELLTAGPRLPIARWLDLVAPDEGAPSLSSSQRETLRVALHRRGIARLGDAQLALTQENRAQEKDARESSVQENGAGASPTGDKRPLSWYRADNQQREDLTMLALHIADACCHQLASWRRAPRTVSEHRHRLVRLLTGPLGWQPPTKQTPTREAVGVHTDAEPTDANQQAGRVARARLLEALDGAWSAVGPAAPVTFDEAWLLAGEPVRQASRSMLGGRGGGVQVLDATEARGRTFEHLFVISMLRDRFPRRIVTDPLLPDALREAMRSLLPDLAVKRRGHAEERYLFAQLLSAGRRVTFSWSRTDEQGRERAPSSLLMPWLTQPRDGTEAAAGAQAEIPKPADIPPTFEQALRAASLASATGPESGSRPESGSGSGTRSSLRPWLEAAFARARRKIGQHGFDGHSHDDHPDDPARRLARARLAVLDAVEPLRRSRASADDGLGPFAGWVGPATHSDDPRHQPTAITLLENLAACPWQTFVARVLRVRTAHDPLETLPGLAADMLGTLVHGVLERIAEGLTADAAGAIGWPSPEHIDQLLLRKARQLLHERGLRFPALAHAAVARARPYVHAAEADWQTPFELIGTEVPFELTVQDAAERARGIHMRVDRVDRSQGRLRLTDYKTGKAFSSAKDPGARRQAMIRSIATGQRLQAAAGLEAALSHPEESRRDDARQAIESRYLYLRPDLEDAVRAISAIGLDQTVRETFAATLAVLGAAWDHGTFLPRLSEPLADVEPMRCRRCPVRDACVRGDTGARQRQRQWASATGAARAPAADRAARDLWNLPTRGKEKR